MKLNGISITGAAETTWIREAKQMKSANFLLQKSNCDQICKKGSYAHPIFQL